MEAIKRKNLRHENAEYGEKEINKMVNRKRSKQLKIYLSDAEHQSFMKQVEKSKLSQTEFFIKCVTGKKIIIVDELKETVTELKKIGNNINQITKNINSGVYLNQQKDFEELKREFVKMNDVILGISKVVK